MCVYVCMYVCMPEIYWADYKCNKPFSNIKLVFLSTLIQLSLPHNTFYLKLRRPGIPMGKHFVKPLLLTSRRIWNIKVNPTAMEEGRWIEMAQKRRGFWYPSPVPRECFKYTRPNCQNHRTPTTSGRKPPLPEVKHRDLLRTRHGRISLSCYPQIFLKFICKICVIKNHKSSVLQ